MIGNPTRPGDLAVCLHGRCAGMMVKVVDFYVGPEGEDREGIAISVGLAKNGLEIDNVKPGDELIFFDAHWQPIRPPAPDEAIEHRENVGVEA